MTSRYLLQILLFLFNCWTLEFSGLTAAVELTPVIDTSTGPVRGQVFTTVVKNSKYWSFKSIRYAEPPIGYRRFKPPVAATPWTDILNAIDEASACPQINLITHNYTGSEDCLFLNVFTPVTELNTKEKKAVMVWIYGGSFMSGNAKTILYGPDFLLEDDVILVTFNYRVGPLGFLNLNHANATGNAGMKDQVLALRWIKKNIDKFGGDPERITIFGNSAGAVSVELHTLSERSRGLFHRGIAISGSALNEWAFHQTSEGLNFGFQLGSLLGTNTTDKDILLSALYAATPFDIARATSLMGEITPSFRPTVEDTSVATEQDYFLTELPIEKYTVARDFIRVPYMLGFTAQETAYTVRPEAVKPISDLVHSAIATIDRLNQSFSLQSPIVQSLMVNAINELGQIPNAALEQYVQETTRKYFSSGIDALQRILASKSSEPVYYYRVSFNPSKSLHELLYHVVANGTAHADDLAYMFYMPIVDLPLDENDPISITRRRVVRMWTNFAKFGNPTPDGEADSLLNITWPDSGSSGLHLEIGQELAVGDRPVNYTYSNVFMDNRREPILID